MISHVPLEFVSATAVFVILVYGPVSSDYPRVIFFTEQAKTLPDRAHRPPSQIGTNAESPDISKQRKSPVFGKIEKGPGSDERVIPVFVAGSIPNSFKVEIDVEVGVANTEHAINRDCRHILARCI